MIKILDFYAPWCAPCKTLAPIIEEVAKEFNVELIKINVDEEDDLSEEYGIRSIPTLILEKNGKQVDRIIGLAPKSRIMELINKQKNESNPK